MQRVLFLGATSCIAGEVAALHAARGDRLHFVGRNREKLDALVARCASISSANSITSATADFDDLAANARVIEDSIAAMGGLDRALLAHGALGDQLESERSFDAAEALLRTNLLSAIAQIIPIANHFERQRSGSLGVITSVAGDRGRPRNYTYGAAKGALNVYLQGVRTRLYEAGVKITTIKLGPVDTPMTRDHEKNVFFGRPEPVAKEIVRAMDRGVPEAYVPAIWAAIMPVVTRTPEMIFQRLPFLSGR
jgi:short-subunit dehydrogenase